MGGHLHLVGIKLSLYSVGDGAIIDAHNVSRHAVLSNGASLELNNVHLVNGGARNGV